MSYDYNSAAYQVFRGINNAAKENSENNTVIMDAASEFSEDNKTNLTVALEDFSDKFKSFNGYNSSNISAKDAKQGFFAGLLGKDPTNIYETEDVQKFLKDEGNLFQKDIFNQALAKDGGINYANKGVAALDYESALNFANADIEAIETALNKVHDGGAKTDGKLNYAEIRSYVNSNDIEGLMETLDLDGDAETITAEEYASYLVAADGLINFGPDNMNQGFSANSADGLIDKEEAQIAKSMSDSELKGYAQQIYDEHFNK